MQTWGSHGDIRPFLALAEGLQAAGNDVHLVITCVDSGAYEGIASASGVKISVVASPVLTPEQQETVGRTAYEIRNPRFAFHYADGDHPAATPGPGRRRHVRRRAPPVRRVRRVDRPLLHAPVADCGGGGGTALCQRPAVARGDPQRLRPPADDARRRQAHPSHAVVADPDAAQPHAETLSRPVAQPARLAAPAGRRHGGLAVETPDAGRRESHDLPGAAGLAGVRPRVRFPRYAEPGDGRGHAAGPGRFPRRRRRPRLHDVRQLDAP